MKTKIYYGEYSLFHWLELILSRDIILPSYQRRFVWDEQVKFLINSFSENNFVPPITIGKLLKYVFIFIFAFPNKF